MQRCISVGFEYRGKEYFAIVRQRVMEGKNYYKVRIMNNRLDSLLSSDSGNLIEEHECRVPATFTDDKNNEAIRLRNCIIPRLAQQIKIETSKTPVARIKEFDLLTPY